VNWYDAQFSADDLHVVTINFFITSKNACDSHVVLLCRIVPSLRQYEYSRLAAIASTICFATIARGIVLLQLAI